MGNSRWILESAEEVIAEESAVIAIDNVRRALVDYQLGEVTTGEVLDVIIRAASLAIRASMTGWNFLDRISPRGWER
ncbi:MAG TPA: hypothetical protein VG435_17230 [Acidimicrobiales bacterium]|nr:hypothetical protein [Acidimicrobiales bacterium]